MSEYPHCESCDEYAKENARLMRLLASIGRDLGGVRDMVDKQIRKAGPRKQPSDAQATVPADGAVDADASKPTE